MNNIALIYIKFILPFGLVLTIGNYFRALYWALTAVREAEEIDKMMISKSKFLMILCIIISWGMAVFVWLSEGFLCGTCTMYSEVLIFVLAIILLIITIISIPSAFIAAISINKKDFPCAALFKNLAVLSYGLAILMYCTCWIIL